MSGVFMDGGSGSQMGHGIQVGGGGDGLQHHDHGSFLDGGGGDQLPGHHSGGPSGSDGGGFLSNILGHNGNGGHSFLSHLLGLDHEGGHGQHSGGGGSPATHHGQAPSQTAIWTSALQHVNLGHVFEGVKFTPNFWFMMMYIVFIAWLFFLYWIRHHEPFADAVLGKNPVTINVGDNRVISGARQAIPIRTSSEGDSLFAPSPRGSVAAALPVVPLGAAATAILPTPNPGYATLNTTAFSAPRSSGFSMQSSTPLQALPAPPANSYSMPTSTQMQALPAPPANTFQSSPVQNIPASPSIMPTMTPNPAAASQPQGSYAGSYGTSAGYASNAPFISQSSAPMQVIPVVTESGARVRLYVNR